MGRTWVISRPTPLPPPLDGGELGEGELGAGVDGAGVDDGFDAGVAEAGVPDVAGVSERELSGEPELGAPGGDPAPVEEAVAAEPSAGAGTGFTLSSIQRKISLSAVRSLVRSPSRWRDMVSMS